MTWVKRTDATHVGQVRQGHQALACTALVPKGLKWRIAWTLRAGTSSFNSVQIRCGNYAPAWSSNFTKYNHERLNVIRPEECGDLGLLYVYISLDVIASKQVAYFR